MSNFLSSSAYEGITYFVVAVFAISFLGVVGLKVFIAISTGPLKRFVEAYKNVERSSHNRVDDLTEWVVPEFYTVVHAKKILQFLETGVLSSGLNYNKLLKSRVTLVSYFLARDAATPPSILARLATSSRAEEIPLEALSNPSIPEEALVKAAKSYDIDIRHCVAFNPSTPPSVLSQLAGDMQLVSTVLDNPNTDSSVFRQILDTQLKDIPTTPKNMTPSWLFYTAESMVNHPNIEARELREVVSIFPDLLSQAVQNSKDAFPLDYLMKRSSQNCEYGIAALTHYRPQLNVWLKEKYGLDAKGMPADWVMRTLGWV